MKKITLLLVALTLLFSAQTMKAQFAGGDGSAATPYQISNRAGLEALENYVGEAGKGKHFVLTADIDLAGANWVPIGVVSGSSAITPDDSHNSIVFCGKLHGNGHKIKNMVISHVVPWLSGLFGHLGDGALIENLHIDGGSINQLTIVSYSRIASIAGRIYVESEATEGVTITNCSNNAPVLNENRNSNTGNTAGGLVGEILNASLSQDVIISSCYNTGNVAGGMHTGGIVGIADGYVFIRNCYFNGEINRNYIIDGTLYGMNASSYNGGITGLIKNYVKIENCYAAGAIINELPAGSSITSSMYSGGITSRADAASGQIKNSVALQTTISSSNAGTTSWRVRGGTSNQTNAPVTNCYAVSNMEFKVNGAVVTKSSTDASSPDGANVTLAAAKTAKFYTDLGWDFTNIWTIEEGVSFPTLRPKGSTTGIQSPGLVNNTLKVSASNGILTVKGLVAGESIRVYTVLGQIVSSRIANNTEESISLPVSGIYLVSAGNQTVKVVNK
jgi:hypothetical protein